MSPSPEDARLSAVPPEVIAKLAVLYDRFAHALDPFSAERDEAELTFEQEVARWHDELPAPKPDLHAFRRAVISRCRQQLRAGDKTSSP